MKGKERWGKWAWGAAAALILLTGCAGPQPSPQKPEMILENSACVVSMNGVEVEGRCSRSLEGIASFSVESPQAMAGWEVRREQDSCWVSVEGVSVQQDGGVMEESLFGRLFSALDSAAYGELTWEEGQWHGALSSGEALVLETDEAGRPASLEVPTWQLEAQFSSHSQAADGTPLTVS